LERGEGAGACGSGVGDELAERAPDRQKDLLHQLGRNLQPQRTSGEKVPVDGGQLLTEDDTVVRVPAVSATRVGPSHPDEKMGMTIRSSLSRLRTFSEMTNAGLGWCGPSGWPGVMTTRSRRGAALVESGFSTLQTPAGRRPPDLVPRLLVRPVLGVTTLELLGHRLGLAGRVPLGQSLVHDLASVETLMVFHLDVDRVEQPWIQGETHLCAPGGTGRPHRTGDS
jgi:hypothetical protein